jgi:hypothetical protein
MATTNRLAGLLSRVLIESSKDRAVAAGLSLDDSFTIRLIASDRQPRIGSDDWD